MAVQRITLRRGTTSEWDLANPVLEFGEIGVEIKSDGSTAFKIGDSSNNWSQLESFEAGSFDSFIASSLLGAAGGVATLDSNSQVPSNQLSNAISEITTAIDAHNSSTSVHGIPNTANLATIEYVDNVASGITTKPAVEAATTAPLDTIYDNGVDGVGATLTHHNNGEWTGVDDVTTGWDLLDGILVKDQTNPAENGRYVVEDLGSQTTPWVLRRCSLCDEPSEIPGMYIFVKFGTANAGSAYVALVEDPVSFIVGTDSITMTQFAGGVSLTAGVGISVAGTEVSIDESVVAKLASPTFTGTLTAGTVNATSITSTTLTGDLTGTASNASKIDNREIFVQANQPSSASSGDIWIKTT